jgi:hypothetical protein
MMHFQIVCGSCGYRSRSDLLEASLKTNQRLVVAIRLALTADYGTDVLKKALEEIPPEVLAAIKEL